MREGGKKKRKTIKELSFSFSLPHFFHAKKPRKTDYIYQLLLPGFDVCDDAMLLVL